MIAGQFGSDTKLGAVLDPYFVYSVSSDGQLTSLLESASEETYPTFTLSELESELAKRQRK